MTSAVKLNNIISLSVKKEASFSNATTLILKQIEDNSKGTGKKYKAVFNEFLSFQLGKDIESATWEEFKTITYIKALEYVEYLKSKGNTPRTINNKIAGLRSLYKELNKVDDGVNVNVPNISQLNAKEAEYKNTYGSLTEEEVEALFAYCRTLPNHHKPLVKELFFKAAYITAIRKNALLSMTWGDITRVKQSSGAMVWAIQIYDKGKMDTTPISDNFYEELTQLRDEYFTSEDRVFKIKEEGLATTLKNFCKANGISEDRKIVIHSLKKASMDKVYAETGSITETARHGHHAGIDLCYQVYVGRNKDLTDRASYSIMENKKDMSALEELSKEELLKLIYSTCSTETINAMNIKASALEKEAQ